jgi:hypothetical protein
MTDKYLEISNVEDLKAGDILCIPSTEDWEWSRLVVYEVTKRLFKTYVLLDQTGGWAPGDIYNFQIIDLDPTKWRLLA